MATKKKAAKKPTYKEMEAFLKKYTRWLKKYDAAIGAKDPGGETPPPPRWP
jgi:hypothetical protein